MDGALIVIRGFRATATEASGSRSRMRGSMARLVPSRGRARRAMASRRAARPGSLASLSGESLVPALDSGLIFGTRCLVGSEPCPGRQQGCCFHDVPPFGFAQRHPKVGGHQAVRSHLHA
jgi:hypothetical protein